MSAQWGKRAARNAKTAACKIKHSFPNFYDIPIERNLQALDCRTWKRNLRRQDGASPKGSGRREFYKFTPLQMFARLL